VGADHAAKHVPHPAVNEGSKSGQTRQRPSESEIREQAYRLYEQGGRTAGRDWEDWFKAQAELTARTREASASVPAKWSWHYWTLRRIRETLGAERAEHALAMHTPFPEGEGGADFVDVANDECTHSMLLAEISLEDAELAEVDAALERIQSGTYGTCEVTGLPISAARLRAVPWARRALPPVAGPGAAPAK